MKFFWVLPILVICFGCSTKPPAGYEFTWTESMCGPHPADYFKKKGGKEDKKDDDEKPPSDKPEPCFIASTKKKQ